MNDHVHLKMLTFARTFVKCNQPEGALRYIQDIAKLKKDDLSIEEVNILFDANSGYDKKYLANINCCADSAHNIQRPLYKKCSETK